MTTSTAPKTWTPPPGAVLFRGTDYASDIRPTDHFCLRCGNQTVRRYPAYIGGRGYETVQSCTAWWATADGIIYSCAIDGAM